MLLRIPSGNITAFVMYCVYGVPGSSVLIEYTHSMIEHGDTKSESAVALSMQGWRILSRFFF